MRLLIIIMLKLRMEIEAINKMNDTEDYILQI
jgi:hypothetical protein